MNSYKVIEKYYHEITKSELLFLTWLHAKYPYGVMRSKMNYPHVNKQYLEKKILPKLQRIGLIKSEGLGTKFSKVVPV